MKKLYLMRHGETMFNVQHRIQGWVDSPLTVRGKQQALEAKQWFMDHDIHFDHVYCSTSERCSDTLELITDQPYVRTRGLKEMFYGEMEAQPEVKLTAKEAETYYLPYGGDSSNDVKDRMVSVLTEIMEKEDHDSVLCMSHGAACFNFLRNWQDPDEVLKRGLGNCCIFIYYYENKAFRLTDVIRMTK